MKPHAVSPKSEPRRPSERRGFAFILILMVVFAAAAMLAWNIERVTTQSLIVEKQIEGYRHHHEMLGVRDLILVWLTREASDSKLPEYAKSGEVAYRVVLPDKVVMTVKIHDGQGTIRSTIDPDDPPEIAERLLQLLTFLPRDRPDLLRRHGAMQVSVAGAPPEVIKALARGNPDIEDALLRIRDRPTIERSTFFQELQRSGIEVADVQALADMIVFDQNRLWRLEVEVVDERSTRRYAGLAQTDRNLPRVLEWAEVLGRAEGDLDPEAAAEVGRTKR